MNRLCVSSVLLAIAITILSGKSVDSSNLEVRIFKCCPRNEVLDEAPVGADSSYVPRCRPDSQEWKPLIYSPSVRNFLPEPPTFWSIAYNTKPSCGHDRVLTRIPAQATKPFVYFESGEVTQEIGTGQNYAPGEFCTGLTGLLVCSKRNVEGDRAAATMRPRVLRCCGENATFQESKGSCIASPERMDAPALLPNGSSFADVVTSFPTCPGSEHFSIVGNTRDAVLRPDGSLEIAGTILPSDAYCVERIEESDRASKVFACPEHAPQKPSMEEADIRFTLYPVGFIISAVFLAGTLVAGWLLPASHHVLHWKCQTYHVACLMLGCILMAIIQLGGVSLHGGGCKALAIMAHFFFLAAFFWLNTMCFNIWWTFRDLRPASLEKGQETLRLRVYSCYAWGGPLVVAGLAALFDHLPPSPQYTFLRPRFGDKVCWFYGDMEILAYFFGPIGVLLAVNLLFFAATARELTCGLWKGEFVKSTTERAALGRVCMKLVVVMGVTWIADVISWAVGGPQYIWYLTDMLNALQGVFIFVVVGCQPQVRAAIKRICNRNPRANACRQGNGLSTTSHGMPSMGDSVTQNPSTKTAPLETIC